MRRGQAAIEYLMMIALALTMVLIVIRYVKQAAEQAARTINQSSENLAEYIQQLASSG